MNHNKNNKSFITLVPALVIIVTLLFIGADFAQAGARDSKHNQKNNQRNEKVKVLKVETKAGRQIIPISRPLVNPATSTVMNLQSPSVGITGPIINSGIPFPGIFLTSPLGGEVWSFGQEVTISWSTANIPPGTNFEVSLVSGTYPDIYRTITTTTSNSILWTVVPGGTNFGTGPFNISVSALGTTTTSQSVKIVLPEASIL